MIEKNSKKLIYSETSPSRRNNKKEEVKQSPDILYKQGIDEIDSYPLYPSEENIKSNYNNEEKHFNKANPSIQLNTNLRKYKMRKKTLSKEHDNSNTASKFVINNSNININNNINIITGDNLDYFLKGPELKRISTGKIINRDDVKVIKSQSLIDMNELQKKDNTNQSIEADKNKIKLSISSSKETKVCQVKMIKPTFNYISSCSIEKIKSDIENSFSYDEECEVKNPDKQIKSNRSVSSVNFKKVQPENNINKFEEINALYPINQLFNELKDRPARYSRSNIELGKNFFKNRFIYDKMNDNVNSTYNVRMTIENVKRSSVYLPDNKNVIKYNSIFLQKIEKGIFSFNLKKYEESYRFLMDSGIIKTEEEFGEILLVVHGWDKYIVGEFLSKDNKPPNNGLKILRYFMKKLEFQNAKFLDAMRFMLSRLNLPKDSALILNIIDVFADTYLNDNKHIFSDLDSVYLLSCTVLTLNTTFHKNIPNLQGFKKHEFVNMNKKVNPEILEDIYEEIKINKLDIVYEYNELIYKRLYAEGLSQNLESQPKIDCNNKFNELKSDEIINLLKIGQTFIKYGTYGNPHIRFVKLSDDEKKLTWEVISSCSLFSRTKYLETINIKDVYIGYSNSKIFEKYNIPQEFDSCCFSIMSTTRTLDLRNDDEMICRKWYQAIKFLIKRTKSISEFQINKNNLKEIFNKKEVIEDIWKTEILPNWSNYRKFILLRDNRTDFAVEKKKKSLKFKRIFIKNLKENVAEDNRFKLIDEKNKSDVIYLWMLGIPDFLRKKLWPLVIGNDLCITETLFQHYLKQVEVVDLILNEELLFKSTGGNNVLNTFGNEQNNSNHFDFNINNYNKQTINPYDNPIINLIIIDIHKSCKKLANVITGLNIEEKKLKNDLFKIIRIFTLIRTDITYLFLLTCENFYSAFECVMNFIIPSFVSKFLLNDENFIKLRLDFFDQLFLEKIPNLHKHFKNLDISLSLFFFNWVEFLFTNFFNYNILLRIWDCYIIKGEIFIYEVGLTILQIQEKHLINIPVKDILRNLKKMQDHIQEEEFFDRLQETDVYNSFNEDQRRIQAYYRNEQSGLRENFAI